MKKFDIELNQLINTRTIKKPNLVTIESLKELAAMSVEKRDELISEMCSMYEFDGFMKSEFQPDSTLIIEFAMEDLNVSIQDISKKTSIDLDSIKKLFTGQLMPWRLELNQLFEFISFLNISKEDMIDAMRNQKITFKPNQLQFNGTHLPRAKGMSRSEAKKAMIQMEIQMAIQDEEQYREKFIQDFKNFVKP